MITELGASLKRFFSDPNESAVEYQQMISLGGALRHECEVLLSEYGIKTRVGRLDIVAFGLLDLFVPGGPRFAVSNHTDLERYITETDGTKRVLISAERIDKFEKADEIRVEVEGKGRRIMTDPFMDGQCEVDDCLVLPRRGKPIIRVGVDRRLSEEISYAWGTGISYRRATLPDLSYYTCKINRVKETLTTSR